MIIGVCTWQILLPGAHSLKEKRMVVRSLKDRIRGKFNVSVSETAFQDVWQRAEITVAIVGTDTAFVDSVLSKIDGLIGAEGRAMITDVSRELW
jgi:uncharacterized protein